MIKLTKPGGSPIFIAPWSVRSLVPFKEGSRIYLTSGDCEVVQERPDEVSRLINRNMEYVFNPTSTVPSFQDEP